MITAKNPDHRWYERPDGDAGVLPPRAYLVNDSPSLSLNGQWEFRSFPSCESAYEFCPWPDPLPPLGERITVPSHWVLECSSDSSERSIHGKPWYTNITYPFPVDPPHVPDANPTAWYRRQFSLGELVGTGGALASGDRVLLRFDGVESAYRVWVNGQWVGQAMGSRLTHEFDITQALACGGGDHHELVVLVHQFSAGSYLEDQDQWWLPGIFRDVVLAVHRGGDIWDAHIDGDWDPLTATGALKCQVNAQPQAFPIRVQIQPPDAEPVVVTVEDQQPVVVAVADLLPWSPENPVLADVTLATSTGAFTRLRTGVRRIQIDSDGVIRANGDPIRFRGVNRHEFHPERGRAVTRSDTRKDFEVMRAHHINAVRTSHYPPAHHALELADDMGLWVVLEGDIETHGFVQQQWAGNPSDDLAWRQAMMDRTARMWHRDKNHPSIVMLSVGNESGTGANLRAAADWLRAHSSLPVHYEGDADAEFTDIHSRMYATPTEWRKIAAGAGHPSWGVAAAARVAAQPVVLCEFAHAMGNGPGGLEDYEQIFRAYPRACGGFVWEFKDHGLYVPAPGGGRRIAYGGDFGEQVHDSNFVLDGLCFADGSPTPGMVEYAAVIDPLWVEFSQDRQQVWVGNGYDHSRLVDTVVCVSRERDGQWVEDTWEVPVLVPGQRHLCEVPAAGVGEQVQVRVRTTVVCGAVRYERTRVESWVGPLSGVVPVGVGVQVRHWPQVVRDTRLSVWRAPTDNDAGTIEPVQERFGDDPRVDWHAWGGTDPRDSVPGAPGAVVSLSQRWEQAGYDRLMRCSESVVDSGGGVSGVVSVWRPAGAGSWCGQLGLTWVRDRDGFYVMEAVIDLDDGPRPARIGLEWDVPIDPTGVVRWCGDGPGEAAPDSGRACRYGQWSAPAVDVFTVYPVPQAAGERRNARNVWLPLVSGQVSIEVVAVELDGRPSVDGLWWSLSPWGDCELARATHADQLVFPAAGSNWVLHLDAAYDGLGSRSCGLDVAPKDRVQARRARIVLRCKGL